MPLAAKEFELLFRLLRYPLIQFANRITKNAQLAEDLVQEVFEKLWREKEKIEFRHSNKAYLYSAVRNKAISEMRKPANSKVTNLGKVGSESLTVHAKDIDERKMIMKLISELPPRRMEVLVLSRFHDLSHKEISKVLGLSVRTIETHIVHGLRDLRNKILASN